MMCLNECGMLNKIHLNIFVDIDTVYEHDEETIGNPIRHIPPNRTECLVRLGYPLRTIQLYILYGI